jgi:hypothetical protein
MNERYKELATEAEEWCRDNLALPTPAEWNDQLFRKYAELIVMECASIANIGIDPDEDYLIGDDILGHFGVEE